MHGVGKGNEVDRDIGAPRGASGGHHPDGMAGVGEDICLRRQHALHAAYNRGRCVVKKGYVHNETPKRNRLSVTLRVTMSVTLRVTMSVTLRVNNRRGVGVARK